MTTRQSRLQEAQKQIAIVAEESRDDAPEEEEDEQ
jgi:exonuclease VII small subunit